MIPSVSASRGALPAACAALSLCPRRHAKAGKQKQDKDSGTYRFSLFRHIFFHLLHPALSSPATVSATARTSGRASTSISSRPAVSTHAASAVSPLSRQMPAHSSVAKGKPQ